MPTEAPNRCRKTSGLSAERATCASAPAVGRPAEAAVTYDDLLTLADWRRGLGRLTLQRLGEPLLSPHLRDMIRLPPRQRATDKTRRRCSFEVDAAPGPC